MLFSGKLLCLVVVTGELFPSVFMPGIYESFSAESSGFSVLLKVLKLKVSCGWFLCPCFLCTETSE